MEDNVITLSSWEIRPTVGHDTGRYVVYGALDHSGKLVAIEITRLDLVNQRALGINGEKIKLTRPSFLNHVFKSFSKAEKVA